MNPEIKNYSRTQEIYTQEGCYIRELSNSTSDPELSIAQARVKPGVTTREALPSLAYPVGIFYCPIASGKVASC